MTARYVRDTYGVPAYKGGRVTVDGKPGTIISFPDAYIKVRFDDGTTGKCHPTWEVDYEINKSKHCTQCHQHKPLENFSPHRRGKYGRHSECKECSVKRVVAYQNANPDKKRAKDSRYYEKNRSTILERQKEYRNKK